MQSRKMILMNLFEGKESLHLYTDVENGLMHTKREEESKGSDKLASTYIHWEK